MNAKATGVHRYWLYLNHRPLSTFETLREAKEAGLRCVGRGEVYIEAYPAGPSPIMYFRYDREVRDWVLSHDEPE